MKKSCNHGKKSVFSLHDGRCHVKKSAFSLHDAVSLEVIARVIVWIHVFIVPDATGHFFHAVCFGVVPLQAVKESACVAGAAYKPHAYSPIIHHPVYFFIHNESIF